MKQIAFTWLLCIFSICVYAQQITVTGTVKDADDNPLFFNRFPRLIDTFWRFLQKI